MTDPSSIGREPDDEQLIARWLAGDQRAATLIVERHATAVARFVASRGERTDVEEVVQDTFVRAFGSFEAFRGESSLRTWLFTIATRLLLDRRRAERRQPVLSPVGERDAVTEYDALDGLVASEAEVRVQAAMARLTPMQRDVFRLRIGEGASYRDIAGLVGTTEGAARVHYHNAMRAVKEYLSNDA